MPLAAILPYVGLAAGVAGTALDVAGNAESQKAMNQTQANEVQEQAGLQKQANQDAQQNIQSSTPANVQTELNTAAANRTNAWEGLNAETAPVASALPATSAGTPTGNAEKASTGAANTWNNLVAGAGAKLGSYGDVQNEQDIQDANTAQQLGVINNFSEGDANLLPLEMQVASQSGQKLSGWGSILSSLGNLVGLAGGSGLFGSAGSSLTASPGQQALNQVTGIAPGSTPLVQIPQTTLPAVNSPNIWSTIYA